MSECLVNPLSTGKFLMNLNRLPGVDFFCQSISTPDISVNSSEFKYLVGKTFETDTQISYGNLTVNFLVDENLNNYNQVLNWMKSISPDEDLVSTKKLQKQVSSEGIGFDYTDVELIFPGKKITYIYKNCVPQNLSGLEFNVSEDLYVSASLTFQVPQLEINTKK